MRPFLASLFLAFWAAVLAAIYAPLWVALTTAFLILAVETLFFAGSYRHALFAWHARQEEHVLRNIVMSLEDALVAYDRDFRVVYFNPAAERLFGIHASDIIGRVIQPKDAEDPSRRRLTQTIFPSLASLVIPRSRAGSYPQTVDVVFEDPRLDLRVTTMPVGDPAGELSGFMKIIRDRTHEVELMKAQSEFVTVASHQLQTPLTDMNWTLESLTQDSSLSEDAKNLATHALAGSKKLSTIVQDLLNIARIEEGRFGYNFETVDLAEFIGRILSEALPQAKRAGIRLYFDRPEGALPHVTIDTQKLTLAFTNILDNAIRYNVQNGEVVVKIEKRANEPFLEISVRDTGIGIPQGEIEKIFNKFFRASNAVKFETEGSGLGLYISKKIIEAHGGLLWAESELNRGSTFRFTLPTDPTLIPTKEVPLEYQ